MKWTTRLKVYVAIALSLVIIPIFYFMLPENHADWWIGFRMMNHTLRALAPLITLIGYYGFLFRHKRSFRCLIIISLVMNVYLFNLDVYNIIIRQKYISVNLLKWYNFEVLASYLVYLFTIFFDAEIIVRDQDQKII